jgi:hypothetical protein
MDSQSGKLLSNAITLLLLTVRYLLVIPNTAVGKAE